MKFITITVKSSELEFFGFLAKRYGVCVFSTRDLGNGSFKIEIGSFEILNLFELGYEFGAYSSIFIEN